MSEMDSYRSLFIAESRENHEIIVKNLLVLENGPDQGAIGELFRAAHSLKGMSATMGFDQLERLCHTMEDVFQLIRSGQIEIGQDLIDSLLKASDDLEILIDDIETGGSGADFNLEEHLRALIKWKDSIKTGNIPDHNETTERPHGQTMETPEIIPETPKTTQKFINQDNRPRPPQPELSDEPGYRIRIRLKKDCDHPNLRGMIILQNLETLGTIVSISPGREVIEDGEFNGAMEILIHTDVGMDALRATVSGAEVDLVLFGDEEPSEIPGQGIKNAESSGMPIVPGKSLEDTKQCPGKIQKEDRSDKSREVKNIRVDITRLDQMMNLVEDLVINRGRLSQIARKYDIKELDETLNMVGRSVSDLQDLMIHIRMIPLSHIFNRFPRAVRDLAHKEQKEVEFLIEGGDTELDRSIMDGLNDPLLHLIRNAVDHGIERPDQREKGGKPLKGILRLAASRDRENVVIVIEDDGAGINSGRVKSKAIERGLITAQQAEEMTEDQIFDLLFLPGFSTAEKVTDVSGRGVGLDVVRTAIDSLKGTIKVESTPGKGTRFELVLPPTMAIVNIIMVRINGRRCAIPVNNVVEVAALSSSRIHRIGNQEAIMIRDEVLPLNRLEDMFGHSDRSEILVVLYHQNKKLAIPVDLIEGQQEVVIKPMSSIIGMCRGVSGVTIPGDGEVVPVLDINSIMREN